MTACVKNHSKRVALAISASLVGALSLGAAAPVAFAAEGAQTLASPSNVWDGIQFTWSVEADKFGEYTVQAGDQFMLSSATDAFGSPVSMSDLTVVYFQDNNGNDKIDSSELVWNATPTVAGNYTAVVVDGRVDTTGWNNGHQAGTYWAGVFSSMKMHTVDFKVVAKSLEGAFAYEGNDVSDTSFKYTGSGKVVNFADADGNKIDLANDGVTATWTNGQMNNAFTPENSGTYTVTLTGDGTKYSGSAVVTFEIKTIDLATDSFEVAPILAGTNAFYDAATSNSGILDQTKNQILVDGSALEPGIVTAQVTAVQLQDGSTTDPSAYMGGTPAKVTLKLMAVGSQAGNFTDANAERTITVVVAGELVQDFYYDGETIPSSGLKFETAKGEKFDPDLFTAVKNSDDKDVPVSVTVTKGGKAVTDYSEPGTYTATITVDIPSDYSYAGSKTVQVTVISRSYSVQPEAFVAIDGKDIKVQNAVEYDGKAVEPVIAVKAGSSVVDPADYTVTYTDNSGKAVDSIVEPGKYHGHIDFGEAVIWKNGASNPVDDIDFTFEVTKATIQSAKADQALYAYDDGEPVKPTFTAFTQKDYSGLSVAIDPAKTGVTYHTAVVDRDGNLVSKGTDDLKASDLTEKGWYVADVTVAADDAHFTGTVTSKPFQISTYAAFGDVDAGSWYAQGVYNAAKLGYMNGVKGTDLFMPLADISRAELAKVFSNMAGRPDKEIYTPTQFGDVDAWAWYAEPIAWASEAGVVTGYQDGSGNFGPNDKATREQVALMLYRYAQAQGQDVSVKDADAALAAYSDGSEVSGWAKEAMAWAVENGVFGVDTDELMPQDNIQRAQVALIAVRYQPERLPEA